MTVARLPVPPLENFEETIEENFKTNFNLNFLNQIGVSVVRLPVPP